MLSERRRSTRAVARVLIRHRGWRRVSTLVHPRELIASKPPSISSRRSRAPSRPIARGATNKRCKAFCIGFSSCTTCPSRALIFRGTQASHCLSPPLTCLHQREARQGVLPVKRCRYHSILHRRIRIASSHACLSFAQVRSHLATSCRKPASSSRSAAWASPTQ